MPKAPDADVEIWFLTGSQSLYGEETLRQVAEQSQKPLKPDNAQSALTGAFRDALANLWQTPPELDGRRPFVLVGAAGIEPATSSTSRSDG